jgi:alpha/beta superfamily hydrolase
MNETEVFFDGGACRLEGLYASQEGTKGVVVTHPHSLMGGTMHNNVVAAVAETFYQKGFATLRFNFRGVGRSEGDFDNGDGERQDITRALAFLREQGAHEIILAGYSFGAWVGSRLFPGHEDCDDFIMISPPIDFLRFDFSEVKGRCGLIICGDSDQFCPRNQLQSVAAELDCRLEIIPYADHFYLGREHELRDRLALYLDGCTNAT